MEFTPQLYKPQLSDTCGRAAALFDATTLPWRNGLLIRAPNWLGDSLMALPALQQLSRFVPEPCGVFVLCAPGLSCLWRAVPWVSGVLPLSGGSRTGRETRRELRRLRPGGALVVPNSFGSALDVFGVGVPVRVGRGGRARGALLTHPLPAWRKGMGVGQCHQLSHYLSLVSAFGPVDAATLPESTLAVDDSEAVAARFGLSDETGGQWLAVAPGAAYGPAKQWEPGRFRDVARWWLANHGRVVIVGAAKEAEAGHEAGDGLSGAVDLTGRTTMHELMGVLSHVTAIVANDSGAMHLGAGLGTPGVAVFGSTDPVATGPLGAPWVIVQDPVDCTPCFQRTCTRADTPYACLDRLTPELVCQALGFLLARAVAAPK